MATKKEKATKKIEEQPKVKPIVWIDEIMVKPEQKKKKNNKK